MPAIGSHRSVHQLKSVGKKGGTVSTKNHHFETFSQRIAKVNIDPVRRVRRQGFHDEVQPQGKPYFTNALERWDDTNLSENFSEFARRVTPLCGSLPHVLHSQDQIIDLLVEYIDKRDALSLEPLLDVLAQLAHDLGVRFEKDFARVVTLVASLAAKHPDVAVVEWSFNCLAWLFKYLSRLLVPDLRPLYDIMAPLLGKEKQRYFVSTFAAEAMTFLVRAAARKYHKSKAWLSNIITHSFQDVRNAKHEKNATQYQQALMTLYADAIKGVNRGINTGGQDIFRCMLETLAAEGESEDALAVEVVCGVMVNIIHHTDADGYSIILSEVLEFTEGFRQATRLRDLRLWVRLLFVTIGVRKGSRIKAWEPLLRNVSAMLMAAGDEIGNAREELVETSLQVVSLAVQTAPLASVLPHLRQITDILCSDRCIKHFLPFCNYFANLGRERFQSLILPLLQKFIVAHWEQNQDQLCILIKKLTSTGCIDKQGQNGNSLSCPTAWQRHILEEYPKMTDSSDPRSSAFRSHIYLTVFSLMEFDGAHHSKFRDILHQHLNTGLQPQSSFHQDVASIVLGQAFACYVECSVGQTIDTALWPYFCLQTKVHARRRRFLDALFRYIKHLSERLDLSNKTLAPLVEALTENLKGASHELRTLSLSILDALYTLRHNCRSDMLATALLVTETPLELHNARSISMRVRNLALSYESAVSDPWLKKAIPYFCFGLLTEKFAQLWHDSCDALAAISQHKEGEDLVANVAFEWLQDSGDIISAAAGGELSSKSMTAHSTRFHCSNLNLVQNLARESVRDIVDASDTLWRTFDEDATPESFASPIRRSQALRVLSNIPMVAEKRSRHLVPILLKWATSDDEEGDNIPNIEANSMTPSNPEIRWSRKDQKALLGLFAQFVNPSVLFKSAEVYKALVFLLSKGDVDIQRSALNAILTWKSPSILPYRESLLNILDDARFREEIAVFVHVDEEDSILQQNHRPELIPILLRLLYGKIVAKGGSTHGRGQKSKRKAVLEALARFRPKELHDFIQIALGPLNELKLIKESTIQEDVLKAGRMSLRKQVGLIKMLEDMLDTLGTRLRPLVTQLLNPILYCIISASRQLSQIHDHSLVESDNVQISLLKVVRLVGLKCLILLFASFPDFEWRPYMLIIFLEVINPRLERLPIDTAQSVSGVLQLFSTWLSSYDTAFFLVDYNDSLLMKVTECLGVPSAKDEVKLFVLEKILKHIIGLAAGKGGDWIVGNNEQAQQRIATKILQPNVDYFLVLISGLLHGSPSKDVLVAAVEVVSQLGPFVTTSSEAKQLIEVSVFLLDQPSHRVNPKTKSDLLRILQHFLPLYDIQDDTELETKIFHTISSLFGYFRDRFSREILSQVLCVFAQKDADMVHVASLCMQLNAFSSKKLDEPDFRQREEGFRVINEDGYRSFSIRQWRPILYNALFYIKENQEDNFRAQSSLTLRCLIDGSKGTLEESSFIKHLILPIMLPSLRKGMHEPSEFVRKEYLSVVAHLVKSFPGWTEVNDMKVLLTEDDDGANFFDNVLHIQQVERLRALRRLVKNVQQRSLQSNNISHLLIPLIEHFIFGKADDEIANNLAAQTVITIGALAEGLEWQQFRAIFRRYSNYINTKPGLEKTVIKLLSSVIESIGQATQTSETYFGLVNGTAVGTDSQEQPLAQTPHSISTLAMTIPEQEKLAEDLVKNLIPPLLGYLHNKDESTVSLRVPVAVAIVKLLNLLPPDQLSTHLPPVLTDVCQILRSKSQEARDMTRKTLAEIAALTGPSCFGFMLRELKGSLQRGYQLHVLSFTVHSILVSTATIFKPGDIDYCLPQIVSVIRNDIFGDIGQEKDAEDYISKAKEVKSSKSYDSMELVAKTATLGHLGSLVNPISEILQERLNIKLVQKIDELLRRIMVGILRNDDAQDHRIMKFCYEIIEAVYRTPTSASEDTDSDHRAQRFLINVKGAKSIKNRGSTSTYDYKMVRFSLDLLRSVVQKHDKLKTSYYLSEFMPIIGDAMLSLHEEIQISALRLLTAIIKVPMPTIDNNSNVYLAEAVKMIKGCPSTNTDLAQAALKLISAILRERRDVILTTADVNCLKYLLTRLKPDLSEPDRQGVTFNFLRAIIARKVNIPEIYEVIDVVAEIMVTNQSRGARDLARGAYFQFFMEYQQTENRLSKQLGFLVQNLDYKYQEGRQSVLEALHLLLSKVPEVMVQELLGTVFLPLVMVLVNDECAACREMAALLLKESFQRADGDRTQAFLALLRTWIRKDEQSMLTRVALQCYSIYFEVHGPKGIKELPQVQNRLLRTICSNSEDADGVDWEVLYFSLQLFSKLSQLFPSKIFAPSSAPIWRSVETCVSFPHAWVKLSAAKLLAMYFADFARTNAEFGFLNVPLHGSEGLQLTADEMLGLANAHLRVLRVPGVNEELAAQVGRNLAFLGRCFGANDLKWKSPVLTEKMDDIDENIEEEINDEVTNGDGEKPAVTFMFERLSAILRRESLTTRALSLIPKTASLQVMLALSKSLPLAALMTNLQTILLPLRHLTDPSIPTPYSTDEAFVVNYKALVSTSQEVMESLQKKLGTTKYSQQLSLVVQGIRDRREGRKVKRKIEAVAYPEKVGWEKRRKGEKKKEKRKERSGEERSRRRGW